MDNNQGTLERQGPDASGGTADVVVFDDVEIVSLEVPVADLTDTDVATLFDPANDDE